jgi:hypothetical protein
MEKQELLDDIQEKISSKTTDNSITPTIIGDILTDIVNYVPKDQLNILEGELLGIKYVLDIPEGVTSIGTTAFVTSNLSEVNFPSTLTSIGPGSFGLNLLSNVILPEGLTSIGPTAFSQNPLLQSVTFPSTLTLIGEFAFQQTNLTSVDLPIGCTVDERAFDEGVVINYV